MSAILHRRSRMGRSRLYVLCSKISRLAKAIAERCASLATISVHVAGEKSHFEFPRREEGHPGSGYEDVQINFVSTIPTPSAVAP